MIRSELDILTSMAPPKVEDWAVDNPFNRPLAGLSEKTFLELEGLPMDALRALLKRKAEMTGYVPFENETEAREVYGGP